MNMKEKKKWSKPQLIILGKGKPEENVLAQCKGIALSGPILSGCRYNTNGIGCSRMGLS